MRQAAFVLLFFAAVLAVGQTSDTPKPATDGTPTLYGLWYVYPPGNPVTDSLRYEFERNKTTAKDELIVSRVCPGDYKEVTARASSPIEVAEDSLRVIKDSSDTKPAQGGTVCEAKVQAAILGYSFSEDGTHVTLTNPGGNPDIVELARLETRTETAMPQNLYGTWLLPPVVSKNLEVQTRIVFYADAEHRERMRQIALCSKGSDSVVSHVDADINVLKDRITIRESVAHEEPLGTMLCKTSIVAGTWHYVLAPGGVVMTVSVQGAPPMKLTRERDPGLNY